MDHRATICALAIVSAVAGCGGESTIDGVALGTGDLRLASLVPIAKPAGSDAGARLLDGAVAAVTPVKASDTTGVNSTSGASAPAPSGERSVYDPGALPIVSNEPSASALWPTWRRGVPRWTWIRIPGSDLSSVLPPEPVPGNPRSRIDAWNGLAADTRGSRLFSAGNGGHADYAGNEVYQIDLSVDAPRWVMLREPTKREHIVASNASQGVYYDYYLDGRPSSTHTYYALNYLASHDAIFKFGAGSIWGTGNEQNWKTDAFSLKSNDWQPAGTWPDVVPDSRKSTGASICMNPATEEVYLAALGLRRFDPKTGTFSKLGARWPDNSTAVYTRGCAVDPVRNRVVYFGDAYRVPTGGLAYDIASDKISRIVFTGDDVAEITAKGSNFAWYEPRIGKFLLKSQVADHVFAIDPVTFEVSRVVTAGGEGMPDAMNGVHTRWQRMPALGGYAYYARHGDGIWFLAVE